MKEAKKIVISYIKAYKIFIFEFRSFVMGLIDKEISLKQNLLLLSHSIEKGMAIPIDDKHSKSGYGRDKATKLLECLERYQNYAYDYNTFENREAMSVLKAYIDYHKNINISVDEIEDRFNKLYLYQDIELLNAGIERISKTLSSDNQKFEEVLMSRRSTRVFSKELIDEKALLHAIKLALKSPTACNRQPIKVYYAYEKSAVNQVSKIILGNKGFENETPAFLVVTVSRGYFDVGEFSQWYINGGIFLGYLVLTLHSLDIGSCIYQWISDKQREKSIRKIFPISSQEAITGIVGIGKYEKENCYLCATRKDIEECFCKV